MKKRSIVAVAAVAVVGFAGAAYASAPTGAPTSAPTVPTAVRCITTGAHIEATVTFKDKYARTTTIHTKSFGDFLTPPVKKCSNGKVTQVKRVGAVKITINGVLVCNNTRVPPLFDPFVFGGGIHNASGDACGGNVGWHGLQPAAPNYAPKPYPVGRTANSFWTGYPQPVGVDGNYWYPGYKLTVPKKTAGWMSPKGTEVRY